jgi:serine/threonine protein kinase
MAKAPLANDEPDAPRLDRRTRIASGPAPMPMPAPASPLGKQTVPPPNAPHPSLTQGLGKKTQVIVGAPPVPPAVTGKTDVPTGPKTKLPGTPVPDASLPSYQETKIGPAPAPPVPAPRVSVPTPAPVPPRIAVPTPAPVPPRVAVPTPAPVPSNEATVIGPAPAAPKAKAKAATEPSDPSDAEMDALISDSLFGDLDEDALQDLRGADATIPAPSRRRDSTAPSLPRPPNIPVPTPPRSADATIPAPSRSIDATVPAPGRGSAPVPVPARTSDPISVRDSASGPIPVPARTSDPIPVRDSASGPVPIRDHSGPIPVPPRPTGPAPKAVGRSDTLPNAELRSTGSTFPPAGRSAASLADTHHDLGAEDDDDDDDPTAHAATQPNLAQEAAAVRRPSTGIIASRPSRAATQSQGADVVGPPVGDVAKVRLVAGKVIPGTRYEIRRWLGEGGMGVVYEVVHTDIERRSALKILRFDLSQQPQMAQVFRDEARAASRLGSPNIVEVYDFGELPDGRLFFAMELLEGVDLVPPDEKASMDPGRLIGILRQVCKGLHRAHEADVVHRDVKPENVILCTLEGRPDHVKIVDFGISAMLAAGERRIGIAGTPQYMAPEQVLGEEFDGRLDVYALGCTAYELLAGKPPFDGEDVETILHKQVHETPLPLHQVRPDVQIPAELEAVIMRCLAKSPAQRWANMADLEAALCEAQIAAGIVTPWDDLPVPPLPDDERRQRIIARMPSRDIVLPAKRSWLWPAVAAVSTLAAAGLAAFLVFGFQPTDEEKDLVEQLTLEAREAASKAAWVIPPPHLDTEVTALIKVGELDALEGSAENLADDRAAELRHEFATTLISHGNRLWDQGGKDFARQYYAWSLMFEPNDEAFARANIEMMTLEMIRQRVLAGEFSDADRLIAGVIVLKVEEDPETKAALNVAVNEGLESDSMPAIAVAQIERSARSAGMELRQPTRGSGLAADGPERRRDRDEPSEDEPTPDPDVAAPPDGVGEEVLVDEGAVVEEDPVAEEGRKKRRQKVDIGLSSKKSFDPARSKTLTNQADAKRKQGLRNEAKSLYGQAIAADPTNGEAHLGLALVHFDQGAYHQARRSAEQAVKNSNRNGRAYKILGDALFKEFLYAEAEEAYENAQRFNVNVGNRLAEVRKKLGK